MDTIVNSIKVKESKARAESLGELLERCEKNRLPVSIFIYSIYIVSIIYSFSTVLFSTKKKIPNCNSSLDFYQTSILNVW